MMKKRCKIYCGLDNVIVLYLIEIGESDVNRPKVT